MEVREVTIRLEATISMGQFENLRPQIEIKVGLTKHELETGTLVSVLENARKDLALSLYEQAEAALKAMNILEVSEDKRLNTAAAKSSSFDWMVKLYQPSALDLMAAVVEELTKEQEAEQKLIEAELNQRGGEPEAAGDTYRLDGLEVAHEETELTVEQEIGELLEEDADDDKDRKAFEEFS